MRRTIYRWSLIIFSLTDRNLTLTFRPNEASLFFAVSIFDDDLPEIDEDFVVSVRMPTGGARIGQQTSATMTVLTNDNAHGLVGFRNSSQSVIIAEMDGDVTVSLDVERNAGTFGQVRVGWELSGSHVAGEIAPASGQVSQWYLSNFKIYNSAFFRYFFLMGLR